MQNNLSYFHSKVYVMDFVPDEHRTATSVKNENCIEIPALIISILSLDDRSII